MAKKLKKPAAKKTQKSPAKPKPKSKSKPKIKAKASPKKKAASVPQAKKSVQKETTRSWSTVLTDSLDTITQRVEALFTSEPTHIVDAIKKDHEALRNFIGVLKDANRDMSERRRAYSLFSDLLHSHTVAEENAVYVPVEKIPERELKMEIAEGFVEHQVCSDLMEKMELIEDAKTWGAHANVLAELVEHHLDEEEEELLPLIKDHTPDELNEAMLVQYMDLRSETQEKVREENAGVLEASPQ